MNLTDSAALPDQLRMIAALRGPRAHPFATGAIELIETHISWVLLAGEHAYKIKKAVGLDFLDYCTLEDRRFFCREELRLNRRTAPDIYLDVVPITGPADEACIDGAGPVIDYAVHMRRFDADAVLSRVLEGEPPPGLARHLAPWGIVALVLVATMLLSDVMNNAATAILMGQLALKLAQQMAVNPDPLLMAVAVGASSAPSGASGRGGHHPSEPAKVRPTRPGKPG